MYTKHQWKSENHYNFKYVQYLPKNYNESEKYPLVIFLHGSGERGDNLDLVCRHGYMKYVRENDQDYPFIFIAPQCPENKYWACYTESLLAFLDDISDHLSVDPKRIYLTGLSMGGTGTWMLAMADPDRFAAIAPVCGTGICYNGACLKDIPILIYHGDCDDVVPINESMNMITAVNSKGGNAKIHICTGVRHNSWEIAYEGDELYKWMLSHKK